MKSCAILSASDDKAEKSMPHHAWVHEDVILSVPTTMQPRDLIRAIRELERLAIEDYLRRTADSGGT